MNRPTIATSGTFNNAWIFLFFVSLLLPVGRALALEPFALYDRFNGQTISTSKWFGGEGTALLGRDANRIIQSSQQGGQLRLRTRSVGFTAADSGLGRNFVYLGVPDPTAVTEMKAAVTVAAISDIGCSGNPSPTQSYAFLIGSFFNTGAPVNEDETNDVLAWIGTFSDSTRRPNRPRVAAAVLECTNVDCTTFNPIDFKDLGPIAVGVAANVAMIWDQPNHQFIFRRDSNNPETTSYVLSDASSPGVPFKSLQVQNDVANCTTTPRPVADIAALFDNVSLNQSAVTPYGASLNPSPSDRFAMLSGIGIGGLLLPLRRRCRHR